MMFVGACCFWLFLFVQTQAAAAPQHGQLARFLPYMRVPPTTNITVNNTTKAAKRAASRPVWSEDEFRLVGAGAAYRYVPTYGAPHCVN